MKYELTEETTTRDGVTLRRIRALKALELSCVSIGDLGGWVQSEANLSQDGDAWVYPDAAVWEDAQVEGDCRIADRAEVRGRARVSDFILMDHDSRILDDVVIDGVARLTGHTTLFGKARVHCGEDGPQVLSGLHADFDISYGEPYALFADPAYAGLSVAVSHTGRICVAPSWDNEEFVGDLAGFREFLTGCWRQAAWMGDAIEAWLAQQGRT